MPTQDFKGTVNGVDVSTLLPTPGAWTTPAFSAGDYTASVSMTWTVASGDVITMAYNITGKIMHLNLRIMTTTIGGTPDTTLYIALPGGVTLTKTLAVPVVVSDNGTWGIGIASLVAGTTRIAVYKDTSFTANWSASTNLTAVQGSLTFEIN